uniref:Regulator of chromosome condensation n=2 Tax=Lygus hesperus TaxID=30085 RepID=A0A0A9YC11_LYGHE
MVEEPNQVPVMVAVVDPHPSTASDGNLETQDRTMEQTPSTGYMMPNAIESQTGSDAGTPVVIDAEENKFMFNQRKKRDYGSWPISNRQRSSILFSDRRIRDTQGAKGSRYTRALRSAAEGTSEGMMDKGIVPVEEDVDENSEKGTGRYRRGTDDNISTWKYQYRFPRDAESLQSTSGAGVERRRRRRGTYVSFGFPILTDWFHA